MMPVPFPIVARPYRKNNAVSVRIHALRQMPAKAAIETEATRDSERNVNKLMRSVEALRAIYPAVPEKHSRTRRCPER